MVSPGARLGGRYRLDERIAGGGMGDVWRGTDEVLDRTVAIKILLPALLEEPGFAERFRGEARTMATINHPGVVDIYDYGNEDGTAFLVMEYVEGDALSRTLSRVHRLTPARTMALIAQAADALHAAHEKGIVHRDVKPGNLLVRPNGTLVLTDFGIARSAAAAQLTQAGSVLGTASYISPEQAAGKTASPLSDLYALGVVAYQCLAGKRPFEGDNPLEIAMRHVRDVPPPLPGDIPPAVRQIVECAMAKDPAARYPSAATMAQVARRAAQSTTTAGVAAAAPTSGGPPGQVSGPPRPVSGPPVSPAFGGATTRMASGRAAPGGTQVMPGTSYPPTGATSPLAHPQGQYLRGAAAVPAAPAVDPTYAPATAPGSGRAAPAGKGGGNAGLWAVLGIIIVLLLCGGGWLLLHGNTDNTGLASPLPSAATTTASRTPTPKQTKPKTTTAAPAAPQPKTHFIRCEQMIGQDADTVRRRLEGDNFTVKVSNDRTGGIKGRVATMSPCGEQLEDTEVTLHVYTGNDVRTPAPGNSCKQVNPDDYASCPPPR